HGRRRRVRRADRSRRGGPPRRAPRRDRDGVAGPPMLSRKTIEAYLFFLLRHKMAVSPVVAALTVFLAWTTYTRLVAQPDFASMYPPKHPYIQLYNAYRNMFGTAFQVQVVVEVKNGTIFDDPATVQKVDRITLALLHDIQGVNPEQVISITHPKLKTTM